MKLFSCTDQSILGRWWWTVDRGLLGALLAIVLFGVIMVTAASPPVAERIGLNEYHFIFRHIIILIPTLTLMLGLSLLSPQQTLKVALGILGAGLFFMVMVLIFGQEIKGAQRWIHIFGFSLQPSEFVKPAFLVAAAWLISRKKETPEFKGTKYAFMLFTLVVSLLLLQPDMGMTFVVTCCFFGIMFLAGLPLRLVVLLSGFLMGALLLAYFVFPHVQSRIDRYLDPESGDTYQVEQSLNAFQNGGLFGTGPGQGTVKLNIPDAHSDFIFSVAGEELGLFFVAILVTLYGFILIRGFNRVIDSDDVYVILATGGLLTMFGLQSLIHMGSALNLLPTKGMTLPFVSYGGSSLLSMGMSMGLVLALTRKQSRRGIARGGLSIRPLGNKQESLTS